MSDFESMRGCFPLQGQSIELRHFSTQHIDDRYLKWLNDPEVLRYSNQRFKSHDYESCRAYMKSFEGTENLFLAIHTKPGKLFVGTMTAYYSIHHKVVDIGIMIGDKNSWGKGIGYDAWETLVLFFLKTGLVRKVTGGTLRCNSSMVNIMQKAAMLPDGVRVAHELVDNVPQDILFFARFQEE